MKPILLFPIGKNRIGHMEYEGFDFESLEELAEFQSNAKFQSALVIANGTLYDAADVPQAVVDAKPEA